MRERGWSCYGIFGFNYRGGMWVVRFRFVVDIVKLFIVCMVMGRIKEYLGLEVKGIFEV